MAYNINNQYFDYYFYKNKYPDLANINSYAKALEHWNNYGEKEGRICNEIFDPLYNHPPQKDLIKKYFNSDYYINKYPEICKNNTISKYQALYHWEYFGRNEGKLCNPLFEPDSNSEINNLLFCIIHHSTSEKHTITLENCIKSIRNFYNNDILVIKTSVSNIPESFNKYNIKVINKSDDNSFFIGAYECIANMPHKHYILIHDSMILLKKITCEILYKRFYSLWHFNAPLDFPEDIFIQYYKTTNLDIQQKEIMQNLYYNEFGIKWLGAFGGCSGGQISYIKQILDAINITTINRQLLYGPINSLIFERYLSLISHTLGIHDTFTHSPSLNGNCHKTCFITTDNSQVADINQISQKIGYNGYFWKLHINRILDP